MKALLAHGASPRVTCPSCGCTALGHAATGGHIAVIEFLLAHGADINAGRHTALLRAVERDNYGLAELLLKRGAAPGRRCPNCGASPLSVATAHRRPDLARLLATRGR